MIDNLDNKQVVYSLFNPYVYKEAAPNMNIIRGIVNDSNNVLLKTLLNILVNNRIEAIDDNILILYLSEIGKSDAEMNLIIKKINELKSLDEEGAKPYRESIKKLCYRHQINYLKYKYEDEPIQFIDAIRNFNYKSLDDDISTIDFAHLNINDLIDKYNTQKVTSRYEFINNSFTVGGWAMGQVVAVVGPPSCGKSLFIQGEAVYFMEQRKKVYLQIMGDLNELDIITRMMCMHLKIHRKTIESNIAYYWEKCKEFFMEFLTLVVVPSGEVSAKASVDYIIKKIKDTKIYFFDYDSNFRKDSALSSYDIGGETYDQFTRLTNLGNLVFVASQPKISYYGDEVLPMESVGESSRKQHICDVIVTIGRNWDAKTPIGKINIAKNRRGDNGVASYVRTTDGLFFPCSDVLYSKLLKGNRYYGYTWNELEQLDMTTKMIEDSIKLEKEKKEDAEQKAKLAELSNQIAKEGAINNE